MKKKIFLIIALIIVIGTGLGIYLNKSLILNKVKSEILKKIESGIGRTISIGKIEYRLFKGILISDIEVSEAPPNDKTAFLKIEQISFNPVLFPFIFKKNILIPTINIDSLSANIARLDENTWNFSSIIEALSSQAKPKTKTEFSVTVLRIKVKDSEIFFEDKTLSPVFSKKLKNLNLLIKPSLPTSLSFELASKIESSNADSQIAINGKINLATEAVESTINLKDLSIIDYLAYLDKLPLAIKNGIISTKLSADFKNDLLSLEGEGTAENFDIQQNNIQIQTDLSSQYKFSYDLKSQDKPFDYKAGVDLSKARLLGLPYLPEINDINGKINILADKLTYEQITGTFQGNILKLSGTLENFQNPILDAKIDASLPFVNLKEIFKDAIDLKDIEIIGDSQIQLAIKGVLSDPENLDFQGQLKLSDAKLKAGFLSEQIDNIQAVIDFDKTKAVWKNLTANFKSKAYTSSGSLNNFTNPQVQMDLSSDFLKLESEFNIQNNLLKIAKLNGNYFQSQFDIKGNADISNAENPLLNLQADAKINPADLGNLNPKLKETLENIKFSGILNTKASLNGRLQNYRNWQFILNSDTALLSVGGLKINDVALNCSQDNSPVVNLKLTGNSYLGTILAKLQFDLAEQGLPFVVETIVDNVDISKLKDDIELKNKEISGMLSSSSTLKGQALDIQNSLNGSGSINIEEGNLWQLELFKGLGEFLLIPEFQKIVFKEAAGDFLIADGKISTDNLMLESEPVNILFEGNVDFAGNIDFKVTTQLAEGLVKDITDLKGIFSSILAQSTNAITIKLSGTVKEPKYKIIPLPGQLFKKAKDFIIQDILP